MRRSTNTLLSAMVLVGTLVPAACGSDTGAKTAEGGKIITVYTGRHYGIEAVFDEFTAATGIEVRFTTGKDPELRERLIAEGANTPADVLMTADAANVELSATAGVLATVASETLDTAIPAELRSPAGTWFALSRRARVIISSTERIDSPPTTYAEVGDPAWKARLCLRPSTHPYTQSLVASMIASDGEAAAEAVVSSWVDNDPLFIDSDTDIYKAVAAGECDIAIANSYYLGRLQTEDPDFPVAITWPEQQGRGAHVNVSTAGITTNAPNPTGALKLLEWLATDGQKTFSDANFEFPANPSVEPSALVAGWGPFKGDTAAIVRLGEFQPAAVELLSRVGYE